MISEQPKWFKIFNKAVDRIAEIIPLVVIWIVFSSILLLFSGFRSDSLAAWAVAIIVAPLLYVVGEMFVQFFRGIKPVRTLRDSIDKETGQKSISGTRIIYLLFETLILLALMSSCWLIVSRVFFK